MDLPAWIYGRKIGRKKTTEERLLRRDILATALLQAFFTQLYASKVAMPSWCWHTQAWSVSEQCPSLSTAAVVHSMAHSGMKDGGS